MFLSPSTSYSVPTPVEIFSHPGHVFFVATEHFTSHPKGCFKNFSCGRVSVLDFAFINKRERKFISIPLLYIIIAIFKFVNVLVKM